MFHWRSKLFSKDSKKKDNSNNNRESPRNCRNGSSTTASDLSSNPHTKKLLTLRKSPARGRCSEDDTSVDGKISKGPRFHSRRMEASSLEAGRPGSVWASQPPSPSYLVSPSPPSNTGNVDRFIGQPLPSPPSSGVATNADGFRSPTNAPFTQNGVLPPSSLPSPSPGPSPGGTEAECATSGYPTDSISSESSIESMEPRDPDAGFLRSPYQRFSQGDFRHFHPNRPEEMQMSATLFLSQGGSMAELMHPGSTPPMPNSKRTNSVARSGEGGGGIHTHIYANGAHGSTSNSSFSSPVLSPQALAPEPCWQKNALTQESGSSQVVSPTSGYKSAANELPKTGTERSPLHSPKRSPIPSRVVSPRHSKVGGSGYDSVTRWPVDPRQAHPLPLPPSVMSAPVSPRYLSLRSPGRAEPLVPTGKWNKGKLIGRGSFGTVYRGMHSETGDMCAIKEVQIISDDHKSKESAVQLQQEINMLSGLRHPNIVHYKGSEMVGEFLYIYLELVSDGSLYKLIQEYDTLEEPVIRRYTRQILLGLKYLHENSIVHRDIKSANILIDQDGRVKLADFGVAKHIKDQGTPLSFKGSAYWMAPEVIMQKVISGHELAVDIWSLGCTVIEMATGKAPWSDYEWVVAMFKVSRSDTPPIPDSLSPEGQDFVRQCLQRNPTERPTALALLVHPFVQIPSDSPELANQAANSLGALGLGERVIVHERSMGHENGATSSSSPYGRLSPQQSFRGESSSSASSLSSHNMRASQVAMQPSLSAPVSPRSSSHQGYRLSPMRSSAGAPGLYSSSPSPSPSPSGVPFAGYSQNAASTVAVNPSSIATRRMMSRRGQLPPLQIAVPRIHNPFSQDNNHFIATVDTNRSGYGRPPSDSECPSSSSSFRRYDDDRRRSPTLDESQPQSQSHSQSFRISPNFPNRFHASAHGSPINIARRNAHDMPTNLS